MENEGREAVRPAQPHAGGSAVASRGGFRRLPLCHAAAGRPCPHHGLYRVRSSRSGAPLHQRHRSQKPHVFSAAGARRPPATGTSEAYHPHPHPGKAGDGGICRTAGREVRAGVDRWK